MADDSLLLDHLRQGWQQAQQVSALVQAESYRNWNWNRKGWEKNEGQKYIINKDDIDNLTTGCSPLIIPPLRLSPILSLDLTSSFLIHYILILMTPQPGDLIGTLTFQAFPSWPRILTLPPWRRYAATLGVTNISFSPTFDFGDSWTGVRGGDAIRI